MFRAHRKTSFNSIHIYAQGIARQVDHYRYCILPAKRQSDWFIRLKKANRISLVKLNAEPLISKNDLC